VLFPQGATGILQGNRKVAAIPCRGTSTQPG
jgi:hypothetical protein